MNMKDENGNRMVAYNVQESDDNGIIWCMVTENVAGYQPMAGRDELASPWYLALLEAHTDEGGKVDWVAAQKRADETAAKYNAENGYTPKDTMEIVASSMRASFQAGA
jgi:hypothetical protein